MGKKKVGEKEWQDIDFKQEKNKEIEKQGFLRKEPFLRDSFRADSKLSIFLAFPPLKPC